MNRRSTPTDASRPGGVRSGIVIGFIALAAIGSSAWWLLRPAEGPANSEPRPPQPADSATSTAPNVVAATTQAAAPPPTDARAQALRQQFQRMLGRYLGSTRVTAPDLRQLLAEFRIAEARALVQERARDGSTEALILLSEMSETCGWRNWDGVERTRFQNDQYQAKVRAAARTLPSTVNESIEIALAIDRQWVESWLDACKSARFDGGEIKQQLRIKADAGDEASLRQLARITDDRNGARRLLLSAAMLGDQDAQVELASSYYHELTYEKRPVDIPRMIYWLEAAAKHSPHAQYLLGECRLRGCDGRPADTEAALALLRAAARGGDGFALKMLADTIAGGTGSFTNEEQYAWLLFEQHGLDSGCVAPMSYPLVRIDNWQRLQSVGQSLSPYGLKSAQSLGDQYWRDHGASARSARGCD